jgi:lambda repressor-like predicted transcriptional regulator
MVNVELAKRRLKERGYSIAGYARANKFNLNTFKMFLRGQWTSNGPVVTSYVAALKRDGLDK